MDDDYLASKPPKECCVSVSGGEVVADFDEYTFCAPRPGLFVGDWRTPKGEINPVRLFQSHERALSHRPPWPLDLGALGILPLEILQQVLLALDMCSLLTFVSSNKSCGHIVTTLKDFKMVVSCPQLAGAVFQLRCRSFGLQQLAASIRSPKCKHCGRFGDLFYLITAERLCYHCWREDRYRKAVFLDGSGRGRKSTQSVASLQRDAIATGLPYVSVPPGSYGPMGEGVMSKRCVAFDRAAFFAKFDTQQRSSDDSILEYRSAGPDVLSYVAVIRAPYLDEGSQIWEEGFFCRACASRGQEHAGNSSGVYSSSFSTAATAAANNHPPNCYPAWDLPYRRYTRNGMKQHLEEYGNVYKLPSQGEDCVQYAHEKPFGHWFSWDDEANELMRMSELLRACRDKKVRVAPLQTFLPNWYSVRTTPPLLRHHSYP
ncbi:hypothetical protein PG995_010254 [Apiospora arundinis]|uniref:F-box domain-containing protein n=1 Tax=Apiospora arundinis TaxID=335852 RepID=A0ABR2ITC5_9PEZI